MITNCIFIYKIKLNSDNYIIFYYELYMIELYKLETHRKDENKCYAVLFDTVI